MSNKPNKPTKHASVASKTAIKDSGGGTLALAIAMLETDTLEATYPFGDVDDFGDPKEDDAANFGVFKMNWLMIRQCPLAAPLIGGRPPSSCWRQVGARINSDVRLATKLLVEAMGIWSVAIPTAPVKNNFWAGHRRGAQGLYNLPGVNWTDIGNYVRAIQTIEAQCVADKTVWTSKIRYWVYVDPI